MVQFVVPGSGPDDARNAATRTEADCAAPRTVRPRMATVDPLAILMGSRYCCIPPLPEFAFVSSAKPTSRSLTFAV